MVVAARQEQAECRTEVSPQSKSDQIGIQNSQYAQSGLPGLSSRGAEGKNIIHILHHMHLQN